MADHEFPYADVTSYIRLLTQCGIVLYGRKIEEVFADVSDEDFWSAISADVDEYDFHAYNARYFASNVLILGRILSFKKEKRILSKYEGGLWMRKNVPENLQYLPELAMKIWFEGEEHILPEEDLDQLRDYLVREIKAPLITEGGGCIFLLMSIVIFFADPFLRIFQAIRHDIHRLFYQFSASAE